ncbi:PepSY-associated TM helix domain-containing protein [Ideonella sp. BN130291]|uniref:PepSY-associated TM helix domain-containing protein n=1 Tax=Ideonella sp. BN130291 TaxID=3112940 RepID=UPI002E2611CC|nr:PepSY-associated TM helix domain-containing protein [Ideonella sp. BN130291]
MSAVLDRPAAAPTPAQRAHRRSALFVRWLRKIHLYVGLWGAALGLLFGATGILMNHRAVMKIPVEKMVQSTAQLRTPEHGFERADQMAAWLQSQVAFDTPPARVKVDPPRGVVWGDQTVQQPERWTFNWHAPHRTVMAEYYIGNRFVKLETQDATAIGVLTRLHTASGVTAFWVLLADTIAGGMIVLSVTGLLLWSRLHPVKLATVAVACAALLGTVGFLWSATS